MPTGLIVRQIKQKERKNQTDKETKRQRDKGETNSEIDGSSTKR